MSSFNKAKMVSYKSLADLSAKQFYAVKLTADNSVNLAGAVEGHGILMNTPILNENAEVAVNGGGAKVKLGVGGCSFGQSLKVDAFGTLIVASVGERALCIAEMAGIAGDVVAVLVGLHQA